MSSDENKSKQRNDLRRRGSSMPLYKETSGKQAMIGWSKTSEFRTDGEVMVGARLIRGAGTMEYLNVSYFIVGFCTSASDSMPLMRPFSVSGQLSQLPSASSAEKESPLSAVKSDDTPNLARDADTCKTHGRPRGYGPEGESDPQRAVHQPETEFSRKLREFKARKHAPAMACSSSSSGIPTPLSERTLQSGVKNSAEHAHGRQPLAPRGDASTYQEPAASILSQDKHALKHSPLPKYSEASPSREREPVTGFRAGRNERLYAHSPFAGGGSPQSREAGALEHKKQASHTEHAYLYKPLTSRSRTAHSPALSVTSCESEHYNDLPTVIRVSPECDDGRSTESVSSFAKRTSNKPVLKNVGAQHVESKVGRLAREMPLKGSPTLPSKPRIDVEKRHTSAA